MPITMTLNQERKQQRFRNVAALVLSKSGLLMPVVRWLRVVVLWAGLGILTNLRLNLTRLLSVAMVAVKLPFGLVLIAKLKLLLQKREDEQSSSSLF